MLLHYTQGERLEATLHLHKGGQNKIELEKIWPRFRVRMKAGVERRSCSLSFPKVSEGLRRVWV